MSRNTAVVLLAATLTAMSGLAPAAEGAATDLPVDPESLAKWQAMRFGMFIHWGPVSLKGTEIGWSRGKQVPREEYDQLYKQFNPVEFDAKEWVQIAKDAGMRYLVFTSKHHDGFCMWNTATTDYNVMNSPFGRDVIKELAEACKEAGIAFGTYYSILDWYQPDYNTEDSQGGPAYALPEGQEPSTDRFQDYIQSHVRELVEHYGPLHTMWFDGEWEKPWTVERGIELFRFCRALDPKMLVNNRVGKDRHGMEGVTKAGSLCPGDFDTPEQEVGAFNDSRPWETCMTICRQWAWKPDDRMKSFRECIHTLVQTAGGDGNLLFNVGPMPDGRIEPRQVERLREMGAWLKANGPSIYGTRGGPFRPGAYGCSTHTGNTIYVHLLEQKPRTVILPPIQKKILSSSLLGGGPVTVEQTDQGIAITVPQTQRQDIDTIVVLELDGPAAEANPVGAQ